MALRQRRGARPRRAAAGRQGFVGLACLVFLAAGLAATWPSVREGGSRFLASPSAGHGEAAPGDHLQSTYRLWLVGHQLEQGRAPWRDPYTFRPESPPRVNFEGWPLGIPFWPLEAAFGPVVAWNLLVLLAFVAAGALTYGWLRELGAPRGAALAGGVVFALAPYRVVQSAGHLLGIVAVLLPAALFAFERGRRGGLRWLAVSALFLSSIPLSGQLQLALGAIPLYLAYALARTRARRVLLAALGGALAATSAGLVVRFAAISGSIESEGRSLAEVDRYSAEWADLVTRHARHGLESFVFLGWATPLLALAGLAVLLRARRLGLAAVLGLGAAVPILLALGTNLALYEALYRAVPPFRYPRVPERLLPIACLALAALVAFAASRIRSRAVLAILVLLLFFDLRVDAFDAVAADRENRAYAALRAAPPGRLLELPVFLPDRHYGSVYHYYAIQAPRERPGGYSTIAPRQADRLARRLRPLNCGSWTRERRRLVERLGVRYVAVHAGLYVG
ncbi:MAG: hypothetical protein H0T09_05760, partial [Actinobacteria bacterium]|nr:hypothetical protein [Actinomycetota bacterium]